jgi:hypothetical protein
MRLRRDGPEDAPGPREPADEEADPARPDPDRRGTWVDGPQTPEDRVAARRRLDRLADRGW